MFNKARKIILLCMVILLTLSSCSGNTVKTTSSNDNSSSTSTDLSLYNEIINKVQLTMNMLEIGDETVIIGKTIYMGYQLYDIDGDGIKELFIYRSSSHNNIFIDSAYTIKDGKVELFSTPNSEPINTIYKNSSTRDDVFYPIRDGRIIKVNYHWDTMDGFSIYDFKNQNTVVYSSLVNIYTKDGNNIDERTLYKDYSDIMSLIGYFNTDLLQGTIVSDIDVGKNSSNSFNTDTSNVNSGNITGSAKLGTFISSVKSAKLLREYSDESSIDNIDKVVFGSNNGIPLEWVVLDRVGDKALLISKLIIENEVFDTSTNVNYSNSYIRNFVNTIVYDKYFNDEEKSIILDTMIDNTSNKLFILSKEDFVKYFGSNLKNNRKATTYITNELRMSRNNITIANKPGSWYHGNSSYWLRDTLGNGNAMYVGYSGRLNTDGDIITINDGIRPAVWINVR